MKKTIFLIIVLGILTAPLAQAATLHISQLSAFPDNTLTVSILVSSPDQAMNAVQGELSFPKDKLEVVSVSKENSLLTFWIREPSYSNINGTINFEGVIFNPGFMGENGNILTITFNKKEFGPYPLTFNNGKILANDGKGTSILENPQKNLRRTHRLQNLSLKKPSTSL